MNDSEQQILEHTVEIASGLHARPYPPGFHASVHAMLYVDRISAKPLNNGREIERINYSCLCFESAVVQLYIIVLIHSGHKQRLTRYALPNTQKRP
jgi:hypothetical protein